MYLSNQKKIYHPKWIRKIFYLFSNNIDCEIFGQGGMSFEKNFKILFKELMAIILRTKTI
jgi:hypothetical protein